MSRLTSYMGKVLTKGMCRLKRDTIEPSLYPLIFIRFVYSLPEVIPQSPIV